MQFETLTLYGRSVQHGAKVDKIDLEEMAFGICCYDRKPTPLLMKCLISLLATKKKKKKETDGPRTDSVHRLQCHRSRPMRSHVKTASLVLHLSIVSQVVNTTI